MIRAIYCSVIKKLQSKNCPNSSSLSLTWRRGFVLKLSEVIAPHVLRRQTSARSYTRVLTGDRSPACKSFQLMSEWVDVWWCRVNIVWQRIPLIDWMRAACFHDFWTLDIGLGGFQKDLRCNVISTAKFVTINSNVKWLSAFERSSYKPKKRQNSRVFQSCNETFNIDISTAYL